MATNDQPWTVQLDVAGVSVATTAPRPYAPCIRGRLGTVESDAATELTLIVRETAPPPPDRAPDQSIEGFDAWEEEGVLWIGRGCTHARVEGDTVEVGGPLEGDADEDTLDDLLQFSIAQALATPGRIMIHGAVISTADDAVVVVGGSGQGKSTLAAAALVGGWQLLGDDLALVDTGRSLVRAVQRPPMVPADIAERHGLGGQPEAGGRGRVRLPVDVLHAGSRRLVGVVSVAHGDEGGVTISDGADLRTLDAALAVPPFRAVIRRHLAAGAALLASPTVRLEHARDPSRRIEVAIESIRAAIDLCRSADRQ